MARPIRVEFDQMFGQVARSPWQVLLGGRRMTAVAKQYGYSDGSGVHRLIQRLEGRAKKDRQLDRQLKSLASQMSRVKS